MSDFKPQARGNEKVDVARPQARRQFFKRRKSCPFSGRNPMIIDYKDVRMLSKFCSERGKMMPSRITAVCVKKQRELSIAIKRARFLALMPYVNA
jgi:small subunit ribosomal protein S18